MSKCIFCSQGQSEEHIVAEWMIRDCGLKDEAFVHGFGRENKTGVFECVSDKIKMMRFCTMNVCAKCNNEWMSRLENRMKPILAPFIQDTWPRNAHDLLHRLFVSSPIIAQWLLKTACTFGDKMSVEVPEDLRHELYEERIPVGIFVDFAHIEQSALSMYMSREWNVYKDNKVEVMSVDKRSFRITWHIRHLVMRISYFPHCELHMRKPGSSVSIYPKLKVFDGYELEGKPHRSYSYRDLTHFEHDTLYYHHGFDDPTHPNSKNRPDGHRVFRQHVPRAESPEG